MFILECWYFVLVSYFINSKHLIRVLRFRVEITATSHHVTFVLCLSEPSTCVMCLLTIHSLSFYTLFCQTTALETVLKVFYLSL